MALRSDGRLHYGASNSKIALLRVKGNEYVGREVYWNSGALSEVKLFFAGEELQRTAWLPTVGNWSAPWVLRRLSAAEGVARGRYVALASLWEALTEGHTVLLKGSWLLERHRAAAVLPRRQELPAGAAWEPRELQQAVEAGKVRIVGLSYCWKEPSHPDPQGEQLQTMAALIEGRLAYTYSDGTRVLEDLAVFWDYASLFQKPRSPPEQEAFDRGLTSVNLWYAHSATEAWLLTRVPSGCKAYGERGWPVFERAVCGLITPQDSFLDIGLWQGSSGVRAQLERWLRGGNKAWAQVARRCQAQREPPMRPERAAELLKTKIFTSGADFEKVRAIYERTYREVMGSARILNFAMLPRWGDREAEALAECLPDCLQLEELRLGGDSIGAAGAAALGAAAAQCRRLRVLILDENPLGDEGTIALFTGMAGCAELEILSLVKTGIQDRGAEAIAAGLPRCPKLRILAMRDCRISDEGAAALGAVLAQCTALETLVIARNRLSAAGGTALQDAWLSADKPRGQCIW